MFVFFVYLFCIFTCPRYMKNLKTEGLLNALVRTISVLTKTEVTVLTGAIAVGVVVEEVVLNDVRNSTAPLVVPIITKEQLIAQVASAGVNTLVRTISVLTKTEVAALAGAATVAVVAEEVAVNDLRNSTAANEERARNAAGDNFKKSGMTENAGHEYLAGSWAQRLNHSRTGGGLVMTSLGPVASTQEYKDLQVQSRNELAASRRSADEEMEYTRQRDRDERERRDSQEEWNSKSTVAKAHDHIERAVSTIDGIPGGRALLSTATFVLKEKLEHIFKRNVA